MASDTDAKPIPFWVNTL